MQKRTIFKRRIWPYLLLAPQLLITLIFFIWPSINAIKLAFLRSDAFGINISFAGFNNFIDIFTDPSYLNSFLVTLISSGLITFVALASGLALALLVNRTITGKGIYKILLICPYAVAPAVAGILWRFLFNPAVGILAFLLQKFGYHWNYMLHSHQAMSLVVIAASWQQFSYNFIFFLAGLQAIPQSLLDAAALDGAGAWRRFWSVTFPLLSPITFFLLIINIIYAFFDTFGIIQIVTQGGPADSTNILVYKVYSDGFQGLDFGGSSAQSVILMVVVILLTILQFRYLEKKVHY